MKVVESAWSIVVISENETIQWACPYWGYFIEDFHNRNSQQSNGKILRRNIKLSAKHLNFLVENVSPANRDTRLLM
jgi:hypothetical protein